jgi:hypothetical protein
MTITFTVSSFELYWIWCGLGVYLTLKCVQSFLEMRTAYWRMKLAELRASQPEILTEDED